MKVLLKSDKFMGDYFGMNNDAAKALHYKHIPPKNTIYIDKMLTKPEQRKVIVHEKVESYMMRKKHLTYPKAHKIANLFELNAHTKGENKPSAKKWEKRYQV